MTNVAGIIGFVDRYLENSGKDYLAAGEAAELMAASGILSNDGDAGTRLVKILATGLIPYAYRENGEWRIPASGGNVARCRID